MEKKPSTNAFREVHQKVRDKKDEARKSQEQATDTRTKDAEREAVREGFDRPSIIVPDKKTASEIVQ